jgi:hypothetical protein
MDVPESDAGRVRTGDLPDINRDHELETEAGTSRGRSRSVSTPQRAPAIGVIGGP